MAWHLIKSSLKSFVLGDREAALRVENGTAIVVGELCRRYCMGMRLLAPKLSLGGDMCHFFCLSDTERRWTRPWKLP